tara:strand:+ start:1028 stop:1846 length:819 start_codon:yes stop_codon:yes gene_type:complete
MDTDTPLNEIQERLFTTDDLDPTLRKHIASHKQLSPEWFEQRKQRITGSKLSQFLFMSSIEDMNKLYEEIFEGRPKEPFDELSTRRCEFGRKHEIHAVLSYLKYHPDVLHMDVTFQLHPKYPSWLGATSDGLIVDTTDRTIKLLEIKCPYGDFEGTNAKAFKSFPEYYIPQIVMQQMCYSIETTIFVVWTRAAFKVYEVSLDPTYAESLLNFLKEFYDKGDMLTSSAYCTSRVASLKTQTRTFRSKFVRCISPRGGHKNSDIFNSELVKHYK